MFNALKEYNEMCVKPSWSWLKKHWKGYSVFVLACWAVPVFWYYFDDLKDYIQNKFVKKSKEES